MGGTLKIGDQTTGATRSGVVIFNSKSSVDMKPRFRSFGNSNGLRVRIGQCCGFQTGVGGVLMKQYGGIELRRVALGCRSIIRLKVWVTQ